jgi:type II secretory pathway pseudopilin PulG
VVIAIIGTLIALLLPAVQHARESSRRSSCANNERQIAMATLEFEQKYRRFPGLFEKWERLKDPIDNPKVTTTTWPVLILRELGHEPIYARYEAGDLPDMYVDTYVCPSDSAKKRSGAEISYVANGGMLGSALNDAVANGVFVNRVNNPGLALLDNHWVDGRDHTLALSENADATWFDEEGWNIWYRADTLPHGNCRGQDRVWNPVFVWALLPMNRVPINGGGATEEDVARCKRATNRRFLCVECDGRAGQAAATRARPSSEHGGGVNVAFGSGRVLFLHDTIDYNIYIALMTSNDKKSASPDPNRVLDDTAWQ